MGTAMVVFVRLSEAARRDQGPLRRESMHECMYVRMYVHVSLLCGSLELKYPETRRSPTARPS